MPDLLTVFARWWKVILGLTLLATIVALVVSVVVPAKYLSVATALPTNSVIGDKARIFNNNIEALYSEFGTADELDKIEGTAALDTIYIATANELNLSSHYQINASPDAVYHAAFRLKKESDVCKSAYGELKVKVWDKDKNRAAQIANTLLQKLQDLHQNLQNQNRALILQKIKEEYTEKQDVLQDVLDSGKKVFADTELFRVRSAGLVNQLQQYQLLIDQYEMALKTNPLVLLVVEKARPALSPDTPKTFQIIFFTFFSAFLFSFLLALFLESRKS